MERLEVSKDQLIETLTTCKNQGYEVLMDLTGVDYLTPEPYTRVVYLLHNPTTYARKQIDVIAKRDEKLPSVTPLWEGADWYERELFDFFGIIFTNHPDLQRILMPDDWIGHPLRRDYPLTEEPVAFKHNVQPKIPSEIIPYVE